MNFSTKSQASSAKGSPLPAAYNMAINDWKAELEFTGSPKAIFPFKDGSSKSAKLVIVPSPANSVFTINTVGSTKAGEKYPVSFLKPSNINSSSGETYSSNKYVRSFSIVKTAAH